MDELLEDRCETCGLTNDKDCNGNPRCECCDPPCLCCYDGGGPSIFDDEDDDNIEDSYDALAWQESQDSCDI